MAKTSKSKEIRYKYLYQNLHNLFDLKKITCKEASNLLKVNYSTLYKWYSGKCCPKEKNNSFLKVCNYLRVTPFEMLSKDRRIPSIGEPTFTDSPYYSNMIFKENFAKFRIKNKLSLYRVAHDTKCEYAQLYSYFGEADYNISDEALNAIYKAYNLSHSDLFKMTSKVYNEVMHSEASVSSLNKRIFSENLRLFCHLTQFTMSDLSKEMSIPLTTVNNWFRGVAVPRNEKTINEIASILGIDADDLVCDYRSSLRSWLCDLLKDFPKDENSQKALLEFTRGIVNDINDGCIYNNQII